MALLTRDDLRHQSRFAWFCLAALAAAAVALWLLDKRGAAGGTVAALLGCLGVILPPRERMAVLPARLRRLPRGLDAAPVLASLISTPGYGLNWFHGANPYDEVVHLVSGLLAGAVLAGLVLADGRPRGAWRLARHGLVFGLGIAVGWEVLEWILGIIGNTLDTVTDILLTTLGAAAGAALWRRDRP
ncbi:DUF2238 domain-containing protein [Roseomonas frigidaquae]|uniref:DUF2238 domain-containing protein n=1 Tax=Falsiroseomonas frigidaquae TaxID=487318 RepID=A0ABX1F0J0_9PROT|nr:DUF2238 domain-containing protein [Falsiroseomonas frigidaquae]NKE45808.1 DUF2238 domain-containing protein [Falsiroseomonas frigidaquae]